MFKALLWVFRPLYRIQKALERLVELEELQLRAKLGSLEASPEGGESYHYLSEAEEYAKEQLKREYERQFNTILPPGVPVPEEWVTQILHSETRG